MRVTEEEQLDVLSRLKGTPKNFHKAAPTGDCLLEISRHENSHLSGQHTYTGREQGTTGESGDHPAGITWITRFAACNTGASSYYIKYYSS